MKFLEKETGSFFFIRHGETDWNKNLLVAGQTDVPLNDYGIQQAEEAGRLLKKKVGISTIVSSPLIRAFKTAKIIGNILLKDVIIIDELKEMNFGEMEGAPVGDKSWIIEWDKGKRFKDAESSLEFAKRALYGIQKALTFPAPVLIVSHGGVWIQLLKYLSGDFQDIPNSIPYYVDLEMHRRNKPFFYPIETSISNLMELNK